MKFLFDRYPIDIILCIFYSFIPILSASSHSSDLFSIILGLPFIIFIPGYIILFALFPGKKTNEGIEFIERIAISIGLSLAIVGLIGIGLNFAPGGIQIVNAFISIFILNLAFAATAIYRWFKT